MKRISLKLLLAILLSVVVPLLGYTLFVRQQMEERLIVDVVRYFLEAKAEDLAQKVNQTLRERMTDAAAWARDPDALAVLEAYDGEDDEVFRRRREILEQRLVDFLAAKGIYAMALLVDRSGMVVAHGRAGDPGVRGKPGPRRGLLDGVNVSYESWFEDAMAVPHPDLPMPVRLRDLEVSERLAMSLVRRDRHRSSLLAPEGLSELMRGPVYVLATRVQGAGDELRGVLVELVEALPESSTDRAPSLERWYSSEVERSSPPELREHLEELRKVARELELGLDSGAAIAPAPRASIDSFRPLCRLLLDPVGGLLGPIAWAPGMHGLDRGELGVSREEGWLAYLREGELSRLEDERVEEGQVIARDRSLLARIYPSAVPVLPETKNPEDYALSYVTPLWPQETMETPRGVFLLLVRWSHIQYDILDRVEEEFTQLHAEYSFESGYAFLFASDADTIIGHRTDPQDPRPERTFRPNYGTSLTKTHGLVDLHEAVLRESRGALRYEYPKGNSKVSGFCRTSQPTEGGFEWVVGVGIDDRDTQQTVSVLGTMLLIGSLVVTVICVLSVWMLSRTLTRPINRLIEFTNEVARGNLAARVDITTDDELGQLGRAFNSMGEAISRGRERQIRLEKEAAWREMARQIAHEIKNPLTPMRLSAGLLPRVYREKPEEFPEVLERSVDTILRQIESLKTIASDFSSFAGHPAREPTSVPLAELLDECLDLYRGMGHSSNVHLEREGDDATVTADREELRRVFINLLDNAFEAMVEADQAEGTIRVSCQREGAKVRIRFQDDGPGLAPEILERLFEPYFSTKTTGTGLGLAISRRVVSDLGGSLRVVEAEGPGTVFEVVLPAGE